MKKLALLFTSFNVIASLAFSLSYATEEATHEQILQPFSTMSLQQSEEDLYQEALNYRDGKIEGFPRDDIHTLRKAEALFLTLANNGYQKAMHNAAMIQYKLKDYFLAFQWFKEASESGLEASSRNLQKMIKDVADNKLTFKSQEELRKIKNLIRQVDFKEKFGDEDLTIQDILPHDIMDYIFDFFALDQAPRFQTVSKTFQEIILKRFERIGLKTVHPHDILYFRSLPGNDALLEWKKISICNDWVERGCNLLSNIYLEDKEKGLWLLQRAAKNGSLRAHKKIIIKVPNSFSEESEKRQIDLSELTLNHLSLLKEVGSILPLSTDEKDYLQAKYSFFLRTDESRAYSIFSQLAGKGHVKSLFIMYLLTNDITYLQRSSEAGNPKAHFALGQLRINEGNIKEAIRLFTLAAEQKHAWAQGNLGVLREREGNIKEAIRLFILAAEQSHAGSQFNLARIREREGNIKEAKQLYNLAANQGNIGAILNLAALESEEGNTKKAKQLYSLAAKQGNADAQYTLGNLLYKEGDNEGATSLYSLAAEQGHADAQFNLGVLLYDKGDIEGASRLYNLAVRQGHAKAQFNLGALLYNKRDLENAIKLFILSAKQGYIPAINTLNQLNIKYK